MFKVIRKMEDIEHLSVLIDMIQKQMSHIGGQTDPVRIEEALKRGLSDQTRTVLFLLTEKDQYQGFSFCNISTGLESGGDYLWMNELYVHEEHRRKSIGSQLVEHMERWCEENEIKNFLCMTSKENKEAQVFYEKKGFGLEEVIWVSKAITK
ncbi:MAG: GNAT family N-acetyltransferase [Clostridia bacterium]|nr:GNAT family N-acetyltransferase [Clostridia bacterium]